MFQFDVKPPNVNGEIKKFLQWTKRADSLSRYHIFVQVYMADNEHL